MYGLAKIRIRVVNNFPKFRSILSANNAASYGWAKFLVPLLKGYSLNNHIVKDYFDFAKYTIRQNSRLFMASLDIDSHFTNILLDETKNIYTEFLLRKTTQFPN